MRSTLVSLTALFCSIAALNLGSGLQGTLLSLRAGMEGFPIEETGLIMSSYYVGFILSSIYAPRLIQNIGHIRSFAAFASIASAIGVCHAVFLSPAPWLLFRGVTGFCMAGLAMIGESWLSTASEKTNRGRLFSIYMILCLSAATLSQPLLNIAPVRGYDLFILVSVIMSLSLVPIAITKSSAPTISQYKYMKLKILYANSPLGVCGALISGFVNGSLWGMGAVFALKAGLDTKEVSLFMMLMIAGGLLFQWPVGKLSDRFDRRKVIIAVCLAAAITALGIILALPHSKWLLLAFAAAFGGPAFSLYALASSHTYDFIKPNQFVAASGSLLLVFGIGAVLGPLNVAIAMNFFGPTGMFAVIGIMEILLCLFALYRMSVRQPPDIQTRKDFVPMVPKVSSTGAIIDPRAEEYSGQGEHI